MIFAYTGMSKYLISVAIHVSTELIKMEIFNILVDLTTCNCIVNLWRNHLSICLLPWYTAMISCNAGSNRLHPVRFWIITVLTEFSEKLLVMLNPVVMHGAEHSYLYTLIIPRLLRIYWASMVSWNRWQSLSKHRLMSLNSTRRIAQWYLRQLTRVYYSCVLTLDVFAGISLRNFSVHQHFLRDLGWRSLSWFVAKCFQ